MRAVDPLALSWRDLSRQTLCTRRPSCGAAHHSILQLRRERLFLATAYPSGSHLLALSRVHSLIGVQSCPAIACWQPALGSLAPSNLVTA